MLHAPPISSVLILITLIILARSTDPEVTRYAVCLASCYIVSCSIHNLYSSFNVWHQVLHPHKRTGRIIIVDFEDRTCNAW